MIVGMSKTKPAEKTGSAATTAKTHRFWDDEYAAWAAAAKAERITMTQWLRDAANAALKAAGGRK